MHLIKQTDNNIYQNYYIEKNLIEINNQRLDYEFTPPTNVDNNPSDYAWLLYIMVGALCVGVVWAVISNRNKPNEVSSAMTNK